MVCCFWPHSCWIAVRIQGLVGPPVLCLVCLDVCPPQGQPICVTRTSFGKRRFYRWARLNCNSGTDGTDGVLPGTLSPVSHLTWPPQSVEGLSGFPAGGDPYRSFKASQKQLHHPGHRSHPALISDSLDSSWHETKSLCSRG